MPDQWKFGFLRGWKRTAREQPVRASPKYLLLIVALLSWSEWSLTNRLPIKEDNIVEDRGSSDTERGGNTTLETELAAGNTREDWLIHSTDRENDDEEEGSVNYALIFGIIGRVLALALIICSICCCSGCCESCLETCTCCVCCAALCELFECCSDCGDCFDYGDCGNSLDCEDCFECDFGDYDDLGDC